MEALETGASDVKRLSLHSASEVRSHLRRTTEEVLRHLEADAQTPEAEAGLTVGDDPIVAAIATLSGATGRRLDGLIVRKQVKDHGSTRRIEGPWRNGLRVAVVDDTLTTGASSLEAARAVTDAGGRVV